MTTALLSLALVTAVPAGTPDLVLRGLDPIELAAGKEVQGQAKWSFDFLRHKYQFASEANWKRFKGEPLKHAVQTGGACGKMGALTGKGHPERWAVVDGKIFLFASNGCRTSFLANQAAYLGPLPRVPAASKQEREAALKLVDQMVNAHGGSSAIGALQRVELVKQTPYQEGGVAKTWVERYGYYGGDRFLSTSEWDKGQVWFAVDGTKSSDGGASGQFAMHPAEIRALRGELLRTPAVILMNAKRLVVKELDPKAGFTLASGDVWFHVLLDPATKRISGLRYRDYASGPICDVEVEYADYQTEAGVLLPHAYRVRKNAGTWSAYTAWAEIRINQSPASAWEMAFGK